MTAVGGRLHCSNVSSFWQPTALLELDGLTGLIATVLVLFPSHY